MDTDGCYNLVAEDRYNTTNINQQRARLLNRTVPTVISVQPGDVLGYYITEDEREGRRVGIQLEERFGENSERVWYNSDTLISEGNGCPLTVGKQEGRILNAFTNSAPVLSVDLGT